MTPVLVDSNVILDVDTADPVWGAWSSEALARAAYQSFLVINPVIYAEVSIRFERIESLEAALPASLFRHPYPMRQHFSPLGPSCATVVGAVAAVRPCPISSSAPMPPWPATAS
jgi:hypothetical protein